MIPPGPTTRQVVHRPTRQPVPGHHLHEFEIDRARYGLPDPAWDTDTLDGARTKLFRVLAAGDRHRLHRLTLAVQHQPTQIELTLGSLIRPGQPAEHLGRESL